MGHSWVEETVALPAHRRSVCAGDKWVIRPPARGAEVRNLHSSASPPICLFADLQTAPQSNLTFKLTPRAGMGKRLCLRLGIHLPPHFPHPFPASNPEEWEAL